MSFPASPPPGGREKPSKWWSIFGDDMTRQQSHQESTFMWSPPLLCAPRAGVTTKWVGASSSSSPPPGAHTLWRWLSSYCNAGGNYCAESAIVFVAPEAGIYILPLATSAFGDSFQINCTACSVLQWPHPLTEDSPKPP